MSLIKTKTYHLAISSKGPADAAKLALVLPGLLDSKDYSNLRSHVDYLAGKGYLAVSFDPPGTWESPGGLELFTPSSYMQATNELIEYFGNRPTFLMGHSRGATMAAAVGSTNSHVEAFAAVMPSHIDGPTLKTIDEDWRNTGYRVELRDLPPGGGLKEKRIELPYSFFEDQLKFDFSNELRASATRKLFIYGDHDRSGATPDRVKAIYDLAGEPKELREIRSGHNYRHKSESIDEVNKLVGEFLDFA